MNLVKYLSIISEILFLILYSLPAHAVLGGKVTPLNVEVKSPNCSISRKALGRVGVSEFFDEAGNIYGVCWKSTRRVKDLTQILGAKYSPLYAVKMKNAVRHKGQRFLDIEDSDLTIKMSASGRSFASCVYDPQQLPEGVSGHEIH